jgi:hypothetical protein
MALPDLIVVLVDQNPELCCAEMDSYIFAGVLTPLPTCLNDSINIVY